MNYKSLTTLEYDKIIDRLVSFAASDKAKERLKKLVPMTDIHDINAALSETSDALSRVYAKGAVSFSGVHDVGASVKRLEIGSSLNTVELLHISSLLTAAARVKNYYEDTTDSLTGYFHALEPLTPLNTEIKRCILSEDEISDDASANLRSIRRQKVLAAERIHTELNKMLNSSSVRNCLQDFVITSRSGRYCLPVKAEYKSQVPGMVHDQSATGSTLFIEPAAVVKLNNDIRELELKEQAEIEAILAELSAKASEFTDELLTDFQVLTTLDFIFAKAQMSKQYKCSCPVMNTNNYINIKKGRHPLIDPHKVVPIDIYLGKNFNLLIITGPNTGGKTVSLKTVGLLTLMAQSGLHIPALDHSELAVFDNVFADIGDEQSIEQSLSTFSSHMTNTVSILKEADAHSLILFDEIGAGTDPTEGAALAISILNDLHKRGITTMATTHYSEIKVYALTTDGVENACCEFDVESLRPTYRLLIGIPGKSNAFAISEKLGLGKDLIEDAKTRISENDENFEDLLADLEKSRVTIEKEQAEINRYKQEIQSLKERLEQKQEKLDASRDKILRDANEEAFRILKEAKDVADETIRNFNKYGKANAPMSEMEKERTRLRDKMNASQKNLADQKKNAVPNHKVPKKLQIGDTVKVISMNLKGTVHTLPNAKGDLYVQMGILRSLVNINDLILIDEDSPMMSGAKANKTGAGKIRMSKSATISPEINLIGKTTDEAIALLDKYLDDAYLSHLGSVRIVHGKGTGALRNAVHTYLKRQKHVKSYHLGEYGEGDAGVTIAEFK